MMARMCAATILAIVMWQLLGIWMPHADIFAAGLWWGYCGEMTFPVVRLWRIRRYRRWVAAQRRAENHPYRGRPPGGRWRR